MLLLFVYQWLYIIFSLRFNAFYPCFFVHKTRIFCVCIFFECLHPPWQSATILFSFFSRWYRFICKHYFTFPVLSRVSGSILLIKLRSVVVYSSSCRGKILTLVLSVLSSITKCVRSLKIYTDHYKVCPLAENIHRPLQIVSARWKYTPTITKCVRLLKIYTHHHKVCRLAESIHRPSKGMYAY